MPNRVCLTTLAGRAGFEPAVAYETGDYEVTLALLTAGLGIALVPASVLTAANTHGLAVRALAGASPARQIHLVHRRRPTALAAAMAGLLHRVAGAVAARSGPPDADGLS